MDNLNTKELRKTLAQVEQDYESRVSSIKDTIISQLTNFLIENNLEIQLPIIDSRDIDTDFNIKLIRFNKRKGLIEVADASTKSWCRVTHFTSISNLTPHQLLYLYDIVEQTVLNMSNSDL